MTTYNFTDIRKRAACIDRGHDFRRSGASDYFNCKCGASALVRDDRISIDHGKPKTLEEQKAEREARKRAHRRAEPSVS